MDSDSGDDEASTHSDQVSPRQKRRRLHSPPKDNSTANVADSQLLWQIQLKEIELEQQLAMERKKLELEKKILLQQQKQYLAVLQVVKYKYRLELLFVVLTNLTFVLKADYD